MFLYLVLNCGPENTRAAILLLKEYYTVECRGPFGNLGLVYASDQKIDPDHMNTLTIIDFV